MHPSPQQKVIAVGYRKDKVNKLLNLIHNDINPVTPEPPKTARDGTTGLLPFVTSSPFMIKMSFVPNSSRREKSFKKCPNERTLVN